MSSGPSGGSARRRRAGDRRGRPGGSGPCTRSERSTVAATSSSVTRLTVSATGMTGIAAPWLDGPRDRVDQRGETSGRAPSWTRTTRSAGGAGDRSNAATPAATESWRRSPPATTRVTRAGSHGAPRDLGDVAPPRRRPRSARRRATRPAPRGSRRASAARRSATSILSMPVHPPTSPGGDDDDVGPHGVGRPGPLNRDAAGRRSSGRPRSAGRASRTRPARGRCAARRPR